MFFTAHTDLSRPNVTSFDVTQDDALTRMLELRVTNQNFYFDIDTEIADDADRVAGVSFLKPDGKRGTYDTVETDGDAVTLDGSTWHVKLAQQMMTCAGTVIFNVWVRNDQTGQKISTFPMYLKVHQNAVPDGVPSDDYFSLHSLADVQQAVEDLMHDIEDLGTNLASDIDYIKQHYVKTVNNKSPLLIPPYGSVELVANDIMVNIFDHYQEIFNFPQPSNTVLQYTTDRLAEVLRNRIANHLYSSDDVHIGSSGMRSIDIDDLLGSPAHVWTGDLVIDIDTLYIGQIIGVGEGGAVLVNCLNRRLATVYSVNSQYPDVSGDISIQKQHIPYSSASPIYYDSPVTNIGGALAYIEEAIEKIAQETGVNLGE